MRRGTLLLLSLAFAIDCSAPQLPSMTLSAQPSAIDDKGGVTEIAITAVYGNGDPGKGAVKVTSTAGSLRDSETVTLDANGKATVGFSCQRVADPLCKERVRIVAEWVVNGELIGAELRLQVGGQFTMAARVMVTWDDAGQPGPCLVNDGGVMRACGTDGSCQRGFTCVINVQGTKECVLRGGTGDVQVTLRFRDPVDLDLHVFEPTPDAGRCHIYYGAPGPNNICGSKGSLDLDSNAGCNLDNVDVENIIYPANRRAPKGDYQVDVDYYSACTRSVDVPWQIEVRAGGELRYWCGSFMPSEVGDQRVVTTFGIQ